MCVLQGTPEWGTPCADLLAPPLPPHWSSYPFFVPSGGPCLPDSSAAQNLRWTGPFPARSSSPPWASPLLEWQRCLALSSVSVPHLGAFTLPSKYSLARRPHHVPERMASPLRDRAPVHRLLLQGQYPLKVEGLLCDPASHSSHLGCLCFCPRGPAGHMPQPRPCSPRTL